jgi:hypothetical protein
VIIFGNYGRSPSWKVKTFGNMEENCEMIWKIWKKSKLKCEKNIVNKEEK